MFVSKLSRCTRFFTRNVKKVNDIFQQIATAREPQLQCRILMLPVRHACTIESEDPCKKRQRKCGDEFKAAPCAKTTKQSKIVIKQAKPEPLPRHEQETRLKFPAICCNYPCMDVMPRFDLLYYRRSDKAKRVYQQTWPECPALVVKPKLLCCTENIIYPKLEKRKPKDRPKTADGTPKCSVVGKCPHLKMAKCRKSRRPPTCLITKSPKDCRKRSAPWPSFSDCGRNLGRPLNPSECRCMSLPSMCQVWLMFHKLKAHAQRGKKKEIKGVKG